MIRTIVDTDSTYLNETSFYLREMINEEYGVARSVEDMTEAIYKSINSCIRTKKPTESTEQYDKLLVYKDINTYSSDNSGRMTTYHLQCTIYDFSDETKYRDFCEKALPSSSYDPLGHNFYINITTFNCQLLSDAMMVIQHEVTHCYETAVNDDKQALSVHERKIYETVQQTMNFAVPHKKENDGYNRLYRMAQAIYSSFRIEMNAFANGLDAVMRNIAYDWETKVRDSDTYRKLDNINDCLNNFNEYLNTIHDFFSVDGQTLENLSLKMFGMTPDRIRIMLMKGRKELARKIGRIIARNQINEMRERQMIF